MRPWASTRRTTSRLAARLLCVATLLPYSGCKRSYYRQQADCESYAAVAGVTADPRFVLPEFDITPDPRSRFADPTDPDFPPMPPDDPDSHRFMHCVYGMKGAPDWHIDGDLDDVEFHGWEAGLPVNAEGMIEVDLPKVVELARLHSRDYQTQMETLYLSALDVTFERFRFDTQWFATNLSSFSTEGPVHGGGDASSILRNDSALESRKLFATGGTLLAGIANSIVYQFAGPNSSTKTSLASFAFTQPLARFAGRAYTLERLTLAERALLANLRQFERYRQGFYIELANQRGGGTNLSRLGGFFGGAGLEGFSGVGGGGFGRVGTFGSLGGGGFAGGQGTGAAAAGGFFGLLQELQNIRNQRASVAALRDTWMQLQAAYEAGRIDRFQVDLARQSFCGAQSVLLNTKAAFDTMLDGYKMEMGLPPAMSLAIKDATLDRFNFIDPASTALQTAVSDFVERMRGGELPADDAARSALIAEVRALYEDVQNQREQVRQDGKALVAVLELRRSSLTNLKKLPEVTSGDVDQRVLDPDRPDFEAKRISDDLLAMNAGLQETGIRLESLATEESDPEAFLTELTQIGVTLSNHVLELSLLQARARLNAVDLVHVDLTEEEAIQTALSNRPDWMNAKAALVDSWRLIRFNANPLKSGVTLAIDGELGTVGNRPFDFRGTNGQIGAGLAFDAPLTRVAERNKYRQALIEYQQQRRALMAFRDEIARGLRANLRQIRLNEINLELRREAVDVSISQVDVTRLNLNRPPKPAAIPGEIEKASPTAALDAINALRFLLDNQNTFLSVWVNHEVQRVLLDYNLGTMRMDERGMWIDPGPISSHNRGGNDVDLLDEGIPPALDLPELPAPEKDVLDLP